jgi:hypothetical protein
MKLIINDINLTYYVGRSRWCFMHYILDKSGHNFADYPHITNAYKDTLFNGEFYIKDYFQEIS